MCSSILDLYWKVGKRPGFRFPGASVRSPVATAFTGTNPENRGKTGVNERVDLWRQLEREGSREPAKIAFAVVDVTHLRATSCEPLLIS